MDGQNKLQCISPTLEEYSHGAVTMSSQVKSSQVSLSKLFQTKHQ